MPRDGSASLIEIFISDVKAATIIEFLHGSDSQIFVDAIDKIGMTLLQ